MKTAARKIAVAVAVALPLMAVDAAASDATNASYVQDNGAQERINFSGKLRMLSQRIPSAACHLAAGVDPEGSMKLLKGATAEFEKIIAGLEYGDEDLGIHGAEERRRTLARVEDLKQKWEPVKVAANAMIAGDTSDAQLNVVLGENMNVLGSAKLLVSELVGQYSDPAAMVQAESMLIDISGRQRMLTQKMSKESCMIQTGHAEAGTADALIGTMDMFEVSLNALRSGMPEAGIRKPPNGTIEKGLDVVLADWAKVKPMLEGILGGGISSSDDAMKFQLLNTTMGDMNKVVGMYAAAAKS